MSAFKELLPYSKIERIKPVFAKSPSESIKDVKARTGCTHIINFGTYVMSTMKPDSGIKLDGKLIKSGYTCEGFSIEGTRLIWEYEGKTHDDWFGTFSAYKKRGVLINAGASGANGQIGVGTSEEGIVIAGADKSSPATPKNFMERNFAECDFAILGDGSYSAQWITPRSKSGVTRNVLWYLCFWVKDDGAMEGQKTENGGTFKAVCKEKTAVYSAAGAIEKGRYIAKGDVCAIDRILTDDLLIKVSYPTAQGDRKAHIKSLVNFRPV